MANIDLSTKVLWAVRIISIFLPQYGYIHPDEFFQSTEITSGEVLHTDSYRAWEFTSTKPLRSITFVHLFGYLPFHILRLLDYHTPYLRLVLPRLQACLLSFVVDYVAYKVRGPDALKIVASSYIALNYFTRTFSNVTECILFSLLVLMSFSTKQLICTKLANDKKSSRASEESTDNNKESKNNDSRESGDTKDEDENRKAKAGCSDEKKTRDESAKKPEQIQADQVSSQANGTPAGDEAEVCRWEKRPPQSSEVLYASVLAAGVFNRPTFLCFALMPFLHRFKTQQSMANFLASCIRLSILALPACAFFIGLDSIYYNGLEAVISDPQNNIVITPLNFLSYNSQVDNLVKHGLHPRWLHLAVNIPLLFGLHAVFVYGDLYRLVRRCETFSSEAYSLHGCTIVPLIILSVFPHQEARFLLPLILPFALRNGSKILRARRSRLMWYVFNMYMFFFFGFMHQASVVPTQMYSGVEGKVLYFHTYMPPRHLAPETSNREVIDLKESSLEVLETALHKHHEGYLVFPAGVDRIVDAALQNVVCTTTDITSILPHLATEYLTSIMTECGYNFDCLLFRSLTLYRIKFQCESAL